MKKKLIIIILLLSVIFSSCINSEAPNVATIGIHPNTSIISIICDENNLSSCAQVSNNSLHMNITAPLSQNGEVETVQRPQELLVRYLEFSQLTSGAIPINQSTGIGGYNVTLNVSHNVTIGDRVALIEGTRIYGGFAMAVSGQIITLDTPIDFNYTTTGFAVTLTRDLNIDGSLTPEIFQIGTVENITLDITRLVFEMNDKTEGDDTTFGGCSALTNGLVLRFVNNATYNIWNVKTNGEINKVAGGDFTYQSKAGPGNFGFTARSTFNGPDKLDTIIKIHEGEMLQIIVQDDLTCLDKFEIAVQGNTDLMTLE